MILRWIHQAITGISHLLTFLLTALAIAIVFLLVAVIVTTLR
jgi:uncharacterized membrane protein YjjB (DUF3815 family)